MEIERKFQISGFPDREPDYRREIFQGYLCTDPEVRIRESRNPDTGESSYMLCIKSLGDLARHEVETGLTAEQYAELKGMLKKPLIHKEWRGYRLAGDLLLECSLVDGGVFAYAEVEFPTEEAALSWTPLDFLGREMTYQSNFRMRTYWENRQIPPVGD